MKRKILSKVAMSLVLTISIFSSTAFAAENETTAKMDYKIKYTNSVGYYIEKEISQGKEFVILGKGKDVAKKYGINLDKAITTYSVDAYDEYYNPTTSISKQVGDSTIYGKWWGGFLPDPTAQGGSVAASTKATTSNTQSKASVKPGASASWKSTAWTDNGTVANISKTVGISGNQAKWDLRKK